MLLKFSTFHAQSVFSHALDIPFLGEQTLWFNIPVSRTPGMSATCTHISILTVRGRVFQQVKQLLASGSPVPPIVLFDKIEEGVGDCRIVRDELTVEVCEVKEGLHFLDFSGGKPDGDSIKHDGVHGKLSWFHDHAKIFNFWNAKLALLKL